MNKMRFVTTTGLHFTGETASLLRTRLTAASLVLSLVLVSVFVANLLIGDVPWPGVRFLILLVPAASFAALRGPQRFTLLQLRGFELAVFGAVVVQLLVMMWTRLLAFAESGDDVSLVATRHAGLAGWALLILTYGILMPNTWQRAFAVLLPVGLLPVGLLVGIRLQHPAVGEAFATDRVGIPLPAPLVAVLIAAFASYTIQRVRREAFAARQLGQYVLRTKIGAGGLGEVYRAEHQLLKRPCAVKLIKPDKANNEATLAKFEREVQATAKLTHWNTVEVYDYGRADDGTFYYVMELLPGLNLEDLVWRHGPLPPERAVHFLRQVCRALREAHAKGLIHRDIKPANIFAAERGGVYDVAKLLDFGLVREQVKQPARGAASESGTFSGSPLYMCPEQATSYDRLDARSDIYSLGAVAYFLITGRPPFGGRTVMEAVEAHAREPVKPPAELNPAVPSDLSQVVVRCLAKNPADRFPTADSLDRALAACQCAGTWTEDQAAAWWRAIDQRRAPPATPIDATVESRPS